MRAKARDYILAETLSQYVVTGFSPRSLRLRCCSYLLIPGRSVIIVEHGEDEKEISDESSISRFGKWFDHPDRGRVTGHSAGGRPGSVGRSESEPNDDGEGLHSGSHS